MAAYPGEGNRMSNYGHKVPSPEELKLLWIECVGHEKSVRANHLAIKGDGSEQWPGIADQKITKPDDGSNVTYFNNNKQHKPPSTYDRLFHIKTGYQSKLHRDDREHTVGLNVHGEEAEKAIPVLSSSAYGHRPPLEHSSREHARIERVMKGFYRTRGTNLPEYGTADAFDQDH